MWPAQRFQSAPHPKVRRNEPIRIRRPLNSPFQSAPHPKVRRNKNYPCFRFQHPVSIRSSPEGEEKQEDRGLLTHLKKFQSAPHPKVRRNSRTKFALLASLPVFQSAPHPKVRRNGCPPMPIVVPYSVSIRSSPEGEEKLGARERLPSPINGFNPLLTRR